MGPRWLPMATSGIVDERILVNSTRTGAAIRGIPRHDGAIELQLIGCVFGYQVGIPEPLASPRRREYHQALKGY